MRVTFEEYVAMCDKPKSSNQYIGFNERTKEDMYIVNFGSFQIKIRNRYLDTEKHQLIIIEDCSIYTVVIDNLRFDIMAMIEILKSYGSKFSNTIKSMRRFHKDHQYELVKIELAKLKKGRLEQ